jgi:hypothetical protein
MFLPYKVGILNSCRCLKFSQHSFLIIITTYYYYSLIITTYITCSSSCLLSLSCFLWFFIMYLSLYLNFGISFYFTHVSLYRVFINDCLIAVGVENPHKFLMCRSLATLDKLVDRFPLPPVSPPIGDTSLTHVMRLAAPSTTSRTPTAMGQSFIRLCICKKVAQAFTSLSTWKYPWN